MNTVSKQATIPTGMTHQNLPKTAQELLDWTWPEIEPFYQELAHRDLTADTLPGWLADWSRLSEHVDEQYNRLYLATTVDTDDSAAQEHYATYLDEIFPQAQQAEQTLKQKLIESGLQVEGFEMPLRRMQAEANLFRAENLPLLADEQKLASEYSQIVGAQTALWEGREVTLAQLNLELLNTERAVREAAWRTGIERSLKDRPALNQLWQELLEVRLSLAANAALPDYRAYRWQQLTRFDYSPEDSLRFHQAIEEVVVPAAQRVYRKRLSQMSLSSLRPWDLDVDPLGRPPLAPFRYIVTLKAKTSAIFHKLDRELGEQFNSLSLDNRLDLENRKHKAPGGYCLMLAVERKPFIFMNGVGTHDDVRTLLHESGHAFHVIASAHLPYFQQLAVPTEFAEVASMGMELLAFPYLAEKEGGFYNEEDAARARVQHLESLLLFWPYMAVVDAFQHWAYTNPQDARDPANCDAQWGALWQRFMPGVDWDGLEDALVTGWQRKEHIFTVPFYYVEYGLAQLGAVQVWQNALQDPGTAVAAYRKALALGGTAPLPQLYQAAGARLAMDAETLKAAVELIENQLEQQKHLSSG